MPAMPQQLMRHESKDTTMRYCVGRDVDATANVLWAAIEAKSNSSGDNSGDEETDLAKEKTQTLTR